MGAKAATLPAAQALDPTPMPCRTGRTLALFARRHQDYTDTH